MYRSFLISALTFIKNKVDNLYYKHYKLYNQETLVRKMFPSIITLDNYSKLNTYLITHSSTEIDWLVSAIMSYYWSEVALYHSRGDYDSVKQLLGLYNFALNLKSYAQEVKQRNP